MYCISINLTSSEWQRIQQAAQEVFPNENLSRAEIVRRYALAGINASSNFHQRIEHGWRTRSRRAWKQARSG